MLTYATMDGQKKKAKGSENRRARWTRRRDGRGKEKPVPPALNFFFLLDSPSHDYSFSFEYRSKVGESDHGIVSLLVREGLHSRVLI